MNFPKVQDRARRTTVILLVMFLFATAGLVFAVYSILAGAMLLLDCNMAEGGLPFWHPELFLQLAGGLTALVVVCAIGQYIVLRSGGGETVAKSAGGREVLRGAGNRQEQQLLNIVDEVALAAGIPAPRVFVFPEADLNAFAAGDTCKNAVVAVSQGALDGFTRDEMQGVVAHEFSHILNGDMRTNMQMSGLLFGFKAVAYSTIGASMAFAAGGYIVSKLGECFSGSKDSDMGLAGAVIALLGLLVLIGGGIFAGCFWILGKIARFFGRVLQSAVSRQREFLADATAVEYTMNPAGLANALKKIGRMAGSAPTSSPAVAALSHMCFSAAHGGFLDDLLSTHPPLVERIKALEPDFDGVF